MKGVLRKKGIAVLDLSDERYLHDLEMEFIRRLKEGRLQIAYDIGARVPIPPHLRNLWKDLVDLGNVQARLPAGDESSVIHAQPGSFVVLVGTDVDFEAQDGYGVMPLAVSACRLAPYH